MKQFFDFIRSSVIPCMQPFPAPFHFSMDNCSIHHIQEVKDKLVQAEIFLLYLPPYSPDLNPAEEMFSYVNKNHDMRFYNIQRLSSNQHLTIEQCGSLILDTTS